MRSGSLLESVLKRDRAVIAVGIVLIAALAWAYLAYLALNIGEMGAGMALPRMGAWTAADFGLMFLMWSVMMAGMMIPSASPMVLMFATINRSRREAEAPYVPTGLFLSAYILVWTAFAALATLANWGTPLQRPANGNDGRERERLPGRRTLDSGGAVSVESLQIHLPKPLPVTCVVSDGRLAGRTLGRGGHGAPARDLLPRLLLGPDGPALRPRSDEPDLDCGPGGVRAAGKSRAGRKSDRLDKRVAVSRLGERRWRPACWARP